jgi:membrane protein implicated in regulation of membrane protease activity
MRRALAAAYVGVVRPTVAFWASHWWLLALMVPALIAAKVFLIMAGVPWWLVAVLAAALIAVKSLLIARHARRTAPQADRHAG